MKIGSPPGGMPPGPGPNPVVGSGATDMVDKLLAGENAAIETARGRQQRIVDEKNEFASLSGMISELGDVAWGMKTPSSFQSLKIESSHPEILEGKITGPANIGSYEMEVRGLARAEKVIEAGFPDVDKTPVGFGYMEIERDDMDAFEVKIDPGSTLRDVADKINTSEAGVRAEIVNTGFPEDPFKLMLTSNASGEAAKMSFDPDTTFLNTKKLIEGRNLDAVFDDVAVTRATNELGDLLEGIHLNAKASEPGTRVQLNVTHDVDSTADTIKSFVEKYNTIAEYANKQFVMDPSGAPAQNIGTRSEVRHVMRRMQSALSQAGQGKYASLSQIGISTNAKTGALSIDEAKVKEALTKDYEGVSAIFTASAQGEGLAGRLATALKGIQDPVNGSLKTRMKGLDKRIKAQDDAIAMQSERLEQKRQRLTDRLGQMNAKIQMMESQASALAVPPPSSGPRHA